MYKRQQVECLKPNFSIPTSQINVQVYKVGTTLHMNGGVILKSRKSHYRQAPYRAYFTCMQTPNQAIKDQNQSKKAQTTPKISKNFHKNKKISSKRVYDCSPNLNLTMFSLGAKEPQPRTKIKQKAKQRLLNENTT